MTKTRKTSTHLLIEIKMQGSLRRYVSRQRKAELSWRRIADQIREQTGVTVTPVSLRNWFQDID